MLIFERLFEKFESSIIFCFHCNRFNSLKFLKLNNLKKDTRDILNLRFCKKKSSWLDNCQTYYDDIIDSIFFNDLVAQKHVFFKRYLFVSKSNEKRSRFDQYNHWNVFQSSFAIWHDFNLFLKMINMFMFLKRQQNWYNWAN